jgi:lysophospholipase L1-like esterase
MLTRRHLLIGLLGLIGFARVVRAADAPFEKEIKAFEEADKKLPPAQNAVLFIGSSTFQKWKTLPQDFPNETVINRGFGGSVMADSVRYAKRIATPYHPKKIVVYAGDNDIAKGATPEQVLADFKAFVEVVRPELPKTEILFLSIKPSIARWKLVDKMKAANALILDYTKTDKYLGYIDIFPVLLGADGKPVKDYFLADGLHMSEAGHRQCIPVIEPRIR